MIDCRTSKATELFKEELIAVDGLGLMTETSKNAKVIFCHFSLFGLALIVDPKNLMKLLTTSFG